MLLDHTEKGNTEAMRSAVAAEVRARGRMESVTKLQYEKRV